MKQLDVINRLEKVFGRRQLRTHAEQRGVLQFDTSGFMTSIVLDLASSREILLSKSFESFNDFEEGYRKLHGSRFRMDSVRSFFTDGPLFLEGDSHRVTKHAFNELLKRQAEVLANSSSAIIALMGNRKYRFDNALDFSRTFVEICLATMISDVLSISMKSSLRALRSRDNTFYFHFHPSRHRNANAALELLDSALTQPRPDPDYPLMVGQSLVMMAYDPLIATICAWLVERPPVPLTDAADRYCATSFVTRVCIEPTEIGSTRFDKGDVAYLSLVAAEDEESSEALSFGSGTHVCIGKRISLQILGLAEQVIATGDAESFQRQPALAPDGAFLSFKN